MGTKLVKLGDVAVINPRLRLEKNEVARKIPMEALTPFQKKIDSYSFEKYSGGVKFQNGDTLVARITPSLENGKTSYVDILESNEVAFGSTEFIVLRADKNVLDEEYLYYIATSDDFRQVAIQSMTGTSGRQRVQNEAVSGYEFKLPPLDVQKQVVFFLNSIDAKIALNQQINDNLLKLMEDFHCKLLRSAVLSQQFKETTILAVADNIVTGKTPSTKQSKYYGTGIPFITIPDMQNTAFVGVTQKSLTRDGASTQPKKEIRAYSLNVSCIGTVGLVTINPIAAHTNQQINSVLVPKDKLWELFFELRSLKKTMSNAASGGTTILNMNKNTFSHLKVNLLNDGLREQFNRVVEPMFEQVLVNDQQNTQLAKLRNILLPRLLAGDIDLSNIEAVMNNA